MQVEVDGDNTHPVYKFLKSEKKQMMMEGEFGCLAPLRQVSVSSKYHYQVNTHHAMVPI